MENQICVLFSAGCLTFFPIQIETLLPTQFPVWIDILSFTFKVNTPPQFKLQFNYEQLKQISQNITVQVWSERFLGSGIIISKQNNEYFVVTNAHVVQLLKPPYQIKTSDDILHQASIIKSIDFQDTDLRILKFTAKKSSYSVATRGSFTNLKAGDKVVAAGYPFNLPQFEEKLTKTEQSNHNFLENNNQDNHDLINQKIQENQKSIDISNLGSKELTMTEGKVVFVLDKALEEGYQIGYTNEIQKGMSGGPVLNEAGELVGINGIHANPIWIIDTLYEDKTLPNDDLQKAIPLYSWAIPVDRILLQSCPRDKVKYKGLLLPYR
jgi:Trypsin-like peptidase domain